MKQPGDQRLRTAASDSPCVQICTMHPSDGYCQGCLRTLSEIGAWATYSAEERAAVLQALDVRRARRDTEQPAQGLSPAAARSTSTRHSST